MAVAKIAKPWVRNLSISPSRQYAVSPYRPYAGIFSGSNNISSAQYQENFI
jgi:hypothetical protein